MNPSASAAPARTHSCITKPLRQLKLVFWGPGASGKTTLLRHLSTRLSPLVVSERIEISTSEDHTLLSDYLALQLPLDTFVILLHLVTTTGQRRLLVTREFAAAGADGVLFVADSRPNAIADNRRSYEELQAYIGATGRLIPVVIMANKQDLPGSLSTEAVSRYLQPPPEHPVLGASALYGSGVLAVVQRLVQDVLAHHVAP